MVQKCKRNQKKVGDRCVSKKHAKIFGKLADEIDVLKLALIGSVTAVGGWAVFSGFIDIFGLEATPAWLKIVGGVVIIIGAYKFGLMKKKI